MALGTMFNCLKFAPQVFQNNTSDQTFDFRSDELPLIPLFEMQFSDVSMGTAYSM